MALLDAFTVWPSESCGYAFTFQCPLGLELLLPTAREVEAFVEFQCPHGLELLLKLQLRLSLEMLFQCPNGIELLRYVLDQQELMRTGFNALTGLSCYHDLARRSTATLEVSMPSRAWVVTARMSNILNSSWYFLCIPTIYRCILAYLPIFFNQLSEFLRCESPSTFLGTCLSHHSFIIFLVTNTNTLLSGLYLISTKIEYNGNVFVANLCQCPLGLIPHFYS